MTAMSKKILCPTDGSDHAKVGLDRAIELAKSSGAHLTICVVNIAHGGARGPTIAHWKEGEVAALLEAGEAAAKAAGVTDVGSVELISREPAPAIITYADQNGYDQIVMGTGDKRGVKRLVLGSVAAEVAGQAHCTVTVAR
jgi:nucleotide-binding universal stress UspA family protein